MSGSTGSVAIVVPMRNEARHIGRFVNDVADQDFDGHLTLIVADGESDDDSVAILHAEAERRGVELRVLPNPSRIAPSGLNVAIGAVNGAELIVRMDCHSRYPVDYVRRCVVAADETGAWNVGGVVVPAGETRVERAVACAMDSPFGGIGWTRHGSGTERVEVDTVTFGAFRPEAFARAGMFDETFVRNQDDEFNMRLRRAGGRIVLDPAIRVHYTPRGSWRGVFRQYHEYGLWKIPVMRRHRAVLGLRSMAPIGLVGSVAALAPLAFVSRWARYGLAAELAVYTAGAGVAAVGAVRQRGESLSLVARVATVFPAFHLGYGTGMARGLWRALVTGRRASGSAPGGSSAPGA